jgi:hypothetical protein
MVGGALAILVSILSVVAFANKSADERIDSKITTHEAVFEAKQQESIGAVRKDVAVLSEKVDNIKEDTNDIKRILERIDNGN